MRIQLVQAEIEEALADFIVKQGFSLQGKSLQISFTAGRGNSGLTADLDIEPAVVGQTPRASTLHAVEVQTVAEAKIEPKIELVKVEENKPADQVVELKTEAKAEVIDPPFDTHSLEEAESIVTDAPMKKDAISLFS